MQAVRRHTDFKWVLLYLQRWLEAPVSMPEGTLVERRRGTPQGAVVSLCWRISYFTMSSVHGCVGNTPTSPSNDMPMTLSAIAEAKHKRLNCVRRLNRGLRTANCNCIRKRPRLCTARTQIAPGQYLEQSFDFLGYTFRPRLASNHHGERFVAFIPAVSKRLVRGCGSAYGVGECIVEATLIWCRSPPGSVQS
jgi:RNA-directed DNA polymerase